MNQRNAYMDVIKYATMFLVLWGHVVQQISMLQNPSSDYVYCLIYTVHMPVFMGICGYFFAVSLSKVGVREYISTRLYKRLKSLFIPMLSFGLLKMLVVVLMDSSNVMNHNWLYLYMRNVYEIWFLGALAVNSVILLITLTRCNYEFKHDIKYLLCGIPFSAIIYGSNSGLFMYLFFLAGYCFSIYCKKYILTYKFIFISIAVYLVCFYLFENMPYEPSLFTFNYSKHTFIGVFVIDILKILLGFSGAYIFFVGIYKILPAINGSWLYRRAVEQGRYTLDIYLLNIIVLEMIMGGEYQNYVRLTGSNPLYSHGILAEVIVTFILAVVIMEIIIFLSKMINRSNLLKKVLFYR